MTEVKRTRSRAPEAPASRVRRARPSHTGMDITVPPAVSELSGYAAKETVEICLRISVDVVEGNMRRGDLENWFKDALYRYHTFRNGYVGYSCHASIKVPRCVRIDKLPDKG